MLISDENIKKITESLAEQLEIKASKQDGHSYEWTQGGEDI